MGRRYIHTGEIWCKHMLRTQFFRSLPISRPADTYAKGSLMLALGRAWLVDRYHGRIHGFDLGTTERVPSLEGPVDLHLPTRDYGCPYGWGKTAMLNASDCKSVFFAVMDGDVAILSMTSGANVVKREHTLLAPAHATPFRDMCFHANTLFLAAGRELYTWNGGLTAQALACAALPEPIERVFPGGCPNQVHALTEHGNVFTCYKNESVFVKPHFAHRRKFSELFFYRQNVFDNDGVLEDVHSVVVSGCNIAVLKTYGRISMARLV